MRTLRICELSTNRCEPFTIICELFMKLSTCELFHNESITLFIYVLNVVVEETYTCVGPYSLTRPKVESTSS